MLQVDDRPAWQGLASEVRRTIARRVSDEAVRDDLAQEVFMRVHERLAQVRDEERLAAWVGRITSNVIADHYRRRPPPAAPVDDVPAAEPEDDRSMTQMLATWVAASVADLPSPYREVLELTELQGLTQREAAQRLGRSLPAIKSQVLRGRAKLLEALRDCCQVELDRRGGIIDVAPQDDCCESC